MNCAVNFVISENLNCLAFKSPTVTSSSESKPCTAPDPYLIEIGVPSDLYDGDVELSYFLCN